MKITTLLKIVAELKKNTDIKTLAKKYEISERTLYRYKKELNEYVNCVEVQPIAPPTTTDKNDTDNITATDKSDTDNNDTDNNDSKSQSLVIDTDKSDTTATRCIIDNTSTQVIDTDKNDTDNNDNTATDKSDTVIITNSMNLHNIKKRIIRR